MESCEHFKTTTTGNETFGFCLYMREQLKGECKANCPYKYKTVDYI